MSAFTVPFRVLLAGLRRLAADGAGDAGTALAVLGQAMAFWARLEADEPEQAGPLRSQLALAVASLAAQAAPGADAPLVPECLGQLARLGAIGEIAIARLCLAHDGEAASQAGVRAQALPAALEGLPASAGLGVIDRLLRLPRRVPAALAAWARTRLDNQWAGDPEDVMAFLAARSEARRPVCYAVQNCLMRGRFGIWLEKLLKIELSVEQLEFLSKVAASLESDRVHALLARLLAPKADRPEWPASATLAALAALAARGACGGAGSIRAIRPLLKHPERGVREAAAAALAVLPGPDRGLMLLKLFEESPDDAAMQLRLAARLAPEDFFALLKGLGPAAQRELLAGFAQLAGALDPDWLETTLERVASASGKDAERLVAAVKALALSWRGRDGEAEFWPGPAQAAGTPERVRLAGPLPGAGAAVMTDVSWRGLDIAALSLSGTRAEGLDATGAAVGKGLVRDCRFAGAVFAGARLTGVVFENCLFSDSDLSDADLRNCRFTGCEFRHVSFAGARLALSRFASCRLESCSFWGARLESASCTGTLLAGCDFSSSWWVGAEFAGCDLEDCLFERARIEKSAVRGGRAGGCDFTDAVFTGLRGDEPAFMEAAEQALARAADSGRPLAGAPRPGLELATPNGALLLSRIAERWFYERDLCVRLRRLLANNRRRLDWAMAKMAGAATVFLDLLPGLVAADAVAGDAAPAPEVRFPDYQPGYAAGLRLAEILGRRGPQGGAARDILPAEGLYVMGSCGTIAQNAGSDIDVWLIVDTGAVPRTQAARLRVKLAAIERFAERAFGLQVHFFLMDTASILAGDFGFSDEESSGSAQSMLLKEEFYRTAMWLAGKKPAWWYMPALASRAAYAARLKRLRAGEGAAPAEVVDLGQIDEMDRSEFFGASLWQIVKALESPFKSVLKFGLLERYYLSRGGEPLLCERIKDNLTAGSAALWETDPYAVLFKDLYEYYKRAGRDDTKRLMGLAFRQKSGLFSGDGGGDGGGGASFADFFFPPMEARIAAEIRSASLTDAAARRAARRESFADMVTLGDMIGRFMFSTYESIQGRLKSPEEDLVINEQDLTKVGRRLFSRLKPRKNKIMRIPFVSSPGGFFTSLEFSCELTPGGGPAWVAKGLAKGGDGKPRIEEVRRDASIVALAAWLAANQIYRPGMRLLSRTLLPPVSLADIRDLIETVARTFPIETTFNPPLGESLRGERILTALLVVNFQASREDAGVREAFAVYATNWGEMFCTPCAADLGLIAGAPERFLARCAPLEIGEDLQLAVFTPGKSARPPAA
jgi:adenylate cyclase class 1